MGNKEQSHLDVILSEETVSKVTCSEPLSLKQVKIQDSFWSDKIELVRNVVIPYQWEVLNDRVPGAEKSHAIKNLEIAAGLLEGEFHGFFFQDTDVAKWIEAVAYSLSTHPDPELEEIVDEAIALVSKAQQEDGYLNSYFTTAAKGKRWTNLEECHELYTAGHFIEAGVAYYEATGKDELLQVVCKFANYIDEVFGPEPDKLKGYDGHQEIELALMRLYEVTKNERYARLGKFFIDERGKNPYYFVKEWEDRGMISAWSNHNIDSPENRRAYLQAHLPVREQTTAVGHAVRVVYMLIGMADVARVFDDRELLEACKTLWNNIVYKQMYITGGIGSTHAGEAFTFDYDLPNDMVYAETCASIGLIIFAQRMLQMELNRDYADVIERALFNIIVGSMSEDGKHYFYVNPLEVWPEASEKNPDKHHVKSVRQAWFGCACCPPNLARFLSSLGKYIYTYNESSIFVHQFISSEVETLVGNNGIKLKQVSNYPWEGNIHFTVVMDEGERNIFSIAIRIPSWCRKASLTVDGVEVPINKIIKSGYAMITREWKNGSEILLNLDMPIEIMKANPKVRADAGKVAIQRGPIVYCMEEVDNGSNLSALSINKRVKAKIIKEDFLQGGVSIILEGEREEEDSWGNRLYESISCEMVEEDTGECNLTREAMNVHVVDESKYSMGDNSGLVEAGESEQTLSAESKTNEGENLSIATPEEQKLNIGSKSNVVQNLSMTSSDEQKLSIESKELMLIQTPRKKVSIKAVPYFMWGNETPGEMQVWLKYTGE